MIDVTKRSTGMAPKSNAKDRDLPKKSILKGPLADQVRSGGADKSMGGKK